MSIGDLSTRPSSRVCVQFVAWNSVWEKTFPEAADAIRKHSSRPLSHSDLFPLWLAAGGLRESEDTFVWGSAATEPQNPGQRKVFYAGQTRDISALR